MDINKKPYRILVEGGEGEIVEKKSRFIATFRKVETEEEALLFIEEMKKKYWDARHNCHAFVIGKNAELMRFSDDGEPSGTAGKPMLEVLLGEGIRNVCVVVTRYFGGVLLGTGGLVRAYTQAVQEGLRHCRMGVMKYGCLLSLETDYNGVGKILYLLGQKGLEPKDAQYTDMVSLKVLVPVEWKESLKKDITEATCGKAKIELEDELYFLEEE